MRIKSYFANTIREAIKQAQAELGPEAVIIASRKTSGEQRSRGEYEVVCGVTAEAPKPQPAPAERKPAASSTDAVAEFIGRIRKAARRKTSGSPDSDLVSRLMTRPELGRGKGDRRIVALVGPPGSGKTTTLVKLAVTHGLAARRPVHIVSMDGYRVNGSDSLRRYASGMGVRFDVLETASALEELLGKARGLVLIDTPGVGPADLPAFGPLASLLSRYREADVHLVLPATMSPADMDAAFARFRVCLPEKLIFTGVDQTSCCRAAATLSVRTETPISFLGTGQQIPEDLEAADRERIGRSFAPALSVTSAA